MNEFRKRNRYFVGRWREEEQSRSEEQREPIEAPSGQDELECVEGLGRSEEGDHLPSCF